MLKFALHTLKGYIRQTQNNIFIISISSDEADVSFLPLPPSPAVHNDLLNEMGRKRDTNCFP